MFKFALLFNLVLKIAFKRFKMAASFVVLEDGIVNFGLPQLSYLTSDYDRVCGRLRSLINACIPRSLAINVAACSSHKISN